MYKKKKKKIMYKNCTYLFRELGSPKCKCIIKVQTNTLLITEKRTKDENTEDRRRKELTLIEKKAN